MGGVRMVGDAAGWLGWMLGGRGSGFSLWVV